MTNSEIENGKGLIKVTWDDVRKRVSEIDHEFAAIVDELNPGKNFPLYLAYYPYGTIIADAETTFIPKNDKEFFKLTDHDLPKEIAKDLGYGKHSCPLSMVMNKNVEWFIDVSFKDERTVIPLYMYSPGALFPFTLALSKESSKGYMPNNILILISGARSTFMLPNIGCALHHGSLKRDFNVKSAPAKNLYEHWAIFKEITESEVSKCDWRSCLLFFSEKWFESIQNAPSWQKLKMYLHDQAWQRVQYEKNRFYYDIAFSMIQKQGNLKPNPYLADTAKHLFAIATGSAPGFAPAVNEDSLPLKILQKAFVESYGLSKYIPTIMQPDYLKPNESGSAVYYSLQNSSTFIFSPQSSKNASTLSEMRELEHIINVFSNELSKESTLCADTILGVVAREINFKYFHNQKDQHHVVRESVQLATLDKRFEYVSKGVEKPKEAKFCGDATFARGCVGITKK